VLSKLADRGLLPEQSDLAEMDALWEEVKREERGLR
jgi:ATP diphosphatase